MGIREEISDKLLARVKDKLNSTEKDKDGQELYSKITAFHNFCSALQVEASVNLANTKLKYAEPAKQTTDGAMRSGPSRDGILWRQF